MFTKPKFLLTVWQKHSLFAHTDNVSQPKRFNIFHHCVYLYNIYVYEDLYFMFILCLFLL